MVLKYFSPHSAEPQNTVGTTIQAIKYAINMGAQIINYSSGGYHFDEQEQMAIHAAQKAGILFVAAAGNDRRNIDSINYYPASYSLNNILSVGASDQKGRMLAFSNFGQRSVDLVAPGKDISSTLPKGRYGLRSGTSQAAAFVSGAAALILKKNPKRSPKMVIQALLAISHKTPEELAKTRFQVSLNQFHSFDHFRQASSFHIKKSPKFG